MDTLLVLLGAAGLGLLLWKLAAPHLERPDPTQATGEITPSEGTTLLALFFLAWVLNNVILGVLASLGAGDAAASVENPAASLVEVHGLARVLGWQSTANGLASLGLALALCRWRGGLGWLGLRRTSAPALASLVAALAAWLAFLPVLSGTSLLNHALLERFTGGSELQGYLLAFQNSQGLQDSVGIWLAMALVIPVAEELLYRGALFGGLRPLLGAGGAAVFSGLAFGLQHDPSAMLPTAALGVLLAWLRVRTGSLAVPCLLHCLQNAQTLALASAFPETSP